MVIVKRNKMKLKKEEGDVIKDDVFWHLRTTDEVLKETNSSKTGLSEGEVKVRLEKFGENKISHEEHFRWYKVLWDKINSLLIYILFGAGLVAFFSHEKLEAFVILFIIFMTISLGFFQEYRADRTIKALNNLNAKKTMALRGGVKKEVLAQNLVVGDLIFLKRGDIVPADCRVLESFGLQVNEAIITGESVEKMKLCDHLSNENLGLGDMENMVFSSTSVTGGYGSAIVVESGTRTEIGKISKSIEGIKNEKSPIQKKIDNMSKKISYIVLGVAFLLFVILLLNGSSFYFSLLLISAVAISGIPESFPLALTLTFSHGIRSMAKQNAIVKDLNSVETLGTTTVICTDKTGTLTENKMRVENFFLPSGKVYETKGVGYEPKNKFLLNGKEIDILKEGVSIEFLNTAVLCNESEIIFENEEWVLRGEPTEGALLTFAKSLGIQDNVTREDNKKVQVLPFNPMKKYMVVVTQNVKKKSFLNFHLKGAGEIVLDKCTHFRNGSKLVKLDLKSRKKILTNIEESNKKGLRVLSLASKSLKCDAKNKNLISNHIEKKDYVYEGFVAIEDPIRTEVYDAVTQCHKAGIKIVMITGDHKLIAKSIGERLGLFTHSSSKVLEGFEIDKLNDVELDEIISDTAIFARTTPEHKLRIVESFQRKGEIVAMTGDGVNDAPALKKANIGISMGKNGTEVAREASNIVLTDDNFATIVKAVREGRTVYSNIRRFIYYLLTGNFTEVVLIFMAVAIGLPLPLTALMILFVNIVTSTIPALALSVEPTHDKVMSQKPRNPKEKLLSEYLLTKIFILIPFLLFGTLGLFVWELFIGNSGLEKAMTVAFVTLITFELFHALNARRLHTTIFDKGFFNNKFLFLAIAISFCLMLLVVYSKVGQEIFSTAPLLFSDWVVVFFVCSFVILFNEIIKHSIKSEFREQSNLQGIKYIIE